MLALRVVEHLDLVEDVLSRVISGLVGFAPNAVALEQVEEALSNSIVGRAGLHPTTARPVVASCDEIRHS